MMIYRHTIKNAGLALFCLGLSACGVENINNATVPRTPDSSLTVSEDAAYSPQEETFQSEKNLEESTTVEDTPPHSYGADPTTSGASAITEQANPNESIFTPTEQTTPAAAASSTVTVSWLPPESNEVERLLSLWEIGGYKIYVGSHKNQLGLALRITDAQVTKASLTNLPSGLNYIAVAAYDVNGVESRPSNTQAFAVP